ncbi:AAA family ATPase [Aquitalea aquatica]|uniref:AAA family ATPase n=1 Tax=Aquitalea aquatica TaxID=3044273 RepID=A0A838Y4M0_9NEIS|nr:ATP-binding protein [Aquitalea magnusonii]MBA4707549.1 AAA family ATPase [Aquitalea magnusonii]
MKIQSIKIANFEGLRTADMQLHAQITMVSGKNGTGKSSLRDAVVMALSGQPTRVSLKKDYGQLVAEGSKASSIELNLADGRKSVVTLPDGGVAMTGKIIEDPDKARAGLPYVLTPAAFAAAPAEGRRTALYALTGCAGSTDEAQKRLLERAADQDKVDAVLPLVLVGFPEAEKHAKQRATEAKGAWRAVTGETYGDKKAEGWKSGKLPVDLEAAQLCEQDLASLDTQVAQAQQDMGTLRARHQASTGRAGQIAQLTELAGKKESIGKKLAADEADLASVRDRVAEISAGPAERKGLLHDLARSLNALVVEEQPLGTDRASYLTACTVLDQYEAQHGPVEEEGAPASAEDVASLPELQKSLAMMERTVANDQRDLKLAQDAEAQLKVQQQQDGGEPVTDEQLAAASDRINTLMASRKKMATDLEAMRANQRVAAEADKKTKDAGKHHADVQAWSLIADALAPDGIPGEILADSLRPVNDMLHGLSQDAGWARVQISRDMDITADGRAYGLLSDSEQWRTDTLLALMIAQLSELKLVVLDRFDVLDLVGRSQLLDLLCDLAEDGALDSAVVCGTMKKAMPSDELIGSFWIENGEVLAVAGAQEERMAA